MTDNAIEAEDLAAMQKAQAAINAANEVLKSDPNYKTEHADLAKASGDMNTAIADTEAALKPAPVPPPATPTAPVTPAAPVTPTALVPTVTPSWGASKVAFDEEWNEGKLNPEVWAADFVGPTQNVTSSNGNISVGANGLSLGLSSPTVGAAITSRPNGTAKPGFSVPLPLEVESQATLQGTNGKVDNWPGLWLLATLNGMSWEVDYCEGINGQVTATLHVWSNNNQTDVSSAGLPLGQLVGEHVYDAILADPNTVTFAVDGKTIGTQSWPTPVADGAAFYNLASIGCGSASWNDPTVIPGVLLERYRRIFVPAG